MPIYKLLKVLHILKIPNGLYNVIVYTTPVYIKQEVRTVKLDTKEQVNCFFLLKTSLPIF